VPWMTSGLAQSIHVPAGFYQDRQTQKRERAGDQKQEAEEERVNEPREPRKMDILSFPGFTFYFVLLFVCLSVSDTGLTGCHT
jgi:hypothetical protein